MAIAVVIAWFSTAIDGPLMATHGENVSLKSEKKSTSAGLEPGIFRASSRHSTTRPTLLEMHTILVDIELINLSYLIGAFMN